MWRWRIDCSNRPHIYYYYYQIRRTCAGVGLKWVANGVCDERTKTNVVQWHQRLHANDTTIISGFKAFAQDRQPLRCTVHSTILSQTCEPSIYMMLLDDDDDDLYPRQNNSKWNIVQWGVPKLDCPSLHQVSDGLLYVFKLSKSAKHSDI